VLDHQPDVVLVDELAHTGADGRKRHEDVAELLAAGIDVMTTVNVANLMSVRDIAARITGAGALEGVPDEFVRAGDVVLVDLPLAGEDDAELLVVHVALADGVGDQPDRLEHYRQMSDDVGARYREVHGTDAADSLAEVARREGAGRVVVAGRVSRFAKLVRGSVASRIRRRAPGVEVDEVSGSAPA
jgi:K+-sensing histidine kinase KdpD